MDNLSLGEQRRILYALENIANSLQQIANK